MWLICCNEQWSTPSPSQIHSWSERRNRKVSRHWSPNQTQTGWFFLFSDRHRRIWWWVDQVKYYFSEQASSGGGLSVSEETGKIVHQVQLKSLRFVILKLEDYHAVVDKTGDASSTWETFCDALSPTECRYVIHDYQQQPKFVSWYAQDCRNTYSISGWENRQRWRIRWCRQTWRNCFIRNSHGLQRREFKQATYLNLANQQ